jgi:apolipoprotein N-acyltransferase
LIAILSNFATSFLLAILSAFLLLLAFPTFDMGWLAWLGLVPLFVAISGRSAKSAFLLSYLCGVVFVSGLYRWVLEAPGYHSITTPSWQSASDCISDSSGASPT